MSKKIVGLRAAVRRAEARFCRRLLNCSSCRLQGWTSIGEHSENLSAATALSWEFREGVGRGMSVIQHVRGVQISSDSPSFGNTSVNDDAETAEAEDSARQIMISLLMRAYNEHGTIRRAVREVLVADYPCKIELIIVEDGSNDALRRSSQRLPILESSCLSMRRTWVRCTPHRRFIGDGYASTAIRCRPQVLA